jgi:hypothetical protein
LPWQPIETAPRDGRAVFVCDGERYLWASWRTPAFNPFDDDTVETWCEDRLPARRPPTHWPQLSPPDDGFERRRLNSPETL